MKMLLIFLGAILLVSSAHAQTPDPQLCQYFARHEPSADTEYQSGVDVDGTSVAPADLPGGGSIQLPENFKIYIQPDMAKFLNFPTTTNYLPQAALGVLIADQKGHLSFNGQPLPSDAESRLIAYCQQQGTMNLPLPEKKKDLLKGE